MTKAAVAKSLTLYSAGYPVGEQRTAPSDSFSFAAVWANDGRERILREEVRLSQPSTAVAPQDPLNPILNRSWNGTTVSLFGARRETVGFMLILEAGSQMVSNASVEVSALTSGSNTITTQSRTTETLTDYRGRNIEIFVLGYLQAQCISRLSYENYNELHVPTKLRAPTGIGPWTSRPGANKYFPDICVPHEARPTFNVAANQSQSVWVDIHIPAAQAIGDYTATITIRRSGVVDRTIPLTLRVRNITLPAIPASKAVAYIQESDIFERYVGDRFPTPGSGPHTAGRAITRHYQRMLHRHWITPSTGRDDVSATVSPFPADDAASLSGALYANDATQQYDGPGVGQGENFAWLGPYGTSWRNDAQSVYNTNLVDWVNYFSANFPSVEYSMYLIDEPQHVRITAVTRGTTTRITATNGISSLTAGQTVRIAGATGLTEINGDWTVSNVSVVDPLVSFDIALDSTALSNYTTPNPAEVSRDFVSIRSWVDKVLAATAPGNTMPTFLTVSLPSMRKFDSRIDVAASWYAVAANPEYQNAVDAHLGGGASKKVWQYNGRRIASGTFAMEDEAVAFEVLSMSMLKKNVARWFYWNINYYRDFQTRTGPAQLTNVWTDAVTFGNPGAGDANYGPKFGFNTTQNDGLLIYPGRDQIFPGSAPEIDAPVASLRLKLWRNAIQTAGIAMQARVINATSTNNRINTRLPTVLWEVDVDDDNDPSFRNAPISWSVAPNDWADDRKFYADIVDPAGA